MTHPSADAPAERRIDLYGRACRALRQIHLWITLVAGGVTGSVLVYRQELANLLEPPPRVSAETGKPHTVAQVIAAARARIGKEFTPFLYEAPTAPGQPTTLRLMALGDAVKGRRVIGVLVDPVSLDLVSWRYEAFSGFLRVLVGLHGNLLMGRAGRVYVGSLGLAVPVLGISGLILWWPGRSRRRAAFLVKRGAGLAPVPRPAPRARQPELPYGVSLARPGAGRGAPEVAAAINPWSGELIDPRSFPPAQTVLAWQQALHFGQGLGWVWRILVCVSGLLPAIFAFTGLAMWLNTQRARRRTVQPLARSISSAKRTGEGQAICSAGLTRPAAIRERADRANLLQFSRDM
jgi:uncharacterized iron-regulated membrane protein